MLGCYDAIAKRLDKLGPVATHILPACTPMLACKGLNSTQFDMVVGIIQGMLETVIAYRRKEIANPSATAISEKKPTHPGGEPDEEEIAKQRAIVLGGWKPAPPSASSKSSASTPSSELPVFPGAPAPASPPSVSSSTPYSATGFDMADVFGSPLPPGGSKGTTSTGKSKMRTGVFFSVRSPKLVVLNISPIMTSIMCCGSFKTYRRARVSLQSSDVIGND